MANSNSTQKSWGGQWTEDKLDCFQKYVKAYLTIMNAYREKFRWKLVYFDGFAGSGSREQSLVADEKAMSLFGEELHDASELHPYQGAAERVVQIEQQMRGFDEYWFIDKNEQNITSLELKLAEYQTRGKKIFRPNDANEEVLNLGRRLREHPKTKVLCLLDPFGMSINWDSIVALAGNGIDL
jgi:three-Cys-motif partner protein